MTTGPVEEGLLHRRGTARRTRPRPTATGYNGIAGALKGENYAVDKLVLAQTGAVPDDASVVVVAGPKTDFFPPEIDALKKYLAKGGKLLLELDPPDKPDSPPLTNLIALAHDWGMTVGNDVVVDVSGMGRLIGTDASVPVAANYPSHPITERFNFLTAYPLARSVVPVTGGVNGHIAQSFVETSPRSWAEADIKSLLTTGKVSFDASKGDKKGPVSIAGGGERRRVGGRAEAGRRRPTRRRPRRASPSSATPTSPPTRRSASRATTICS